MMNAFLQPINSATHPVEIIQAVLILIACFAVPFIISYFLPFRRNFRLGSARLKEQDLEKAKTHFEKCVKLKPRSYAALLSLASVDTELKNFDEAIRHSMEAVKLSPEKFAGYMSLSVVYLNMKNYDQALYYINEAFARDPSDADKHILYVNRGVIWNKRKEHDKAIADYKKAVEILDNNWTVFNNIGYTLLNTGRYEESIPYFDRSIELDSERAFSFNNRGFAHSNLGKYEQAFADFRKSYNIDPSNPLLYKYRGLTLYMIGEHEEALKDLLKAIEKDPELENDLSEKINHLKEKSIH
jgi:tetratricopeptide (TPR) repeat protein